MMTAKGRLSRDAEAAVVSIGHERCADLGASLKREWLVTNGLGGYASGTIGGVLTRRYHGLLIAALRPPLGRTVLVSKADERIAYDGRAYALSANRWHDGTIEPRGFVYINAFRLERSIPVWTYQIADAVIEKRVWMEHGANTTYVQYRVLRCRMPLDVTVGVAVNYRDFHCTTRAGDWHMLVTPIDGGLRVEPYEGAAAIYLFSDLALAQAEHTWQRDCELTAEAERGLDHHEDFLHAGDFTCSLGEGETVMLVFSTEGEALVDAENALDRHRARERSILDWWRLSGPAQTNQDAPWLRQLAFAADQFIVARPVPGDPSGRSIIAGYPWFGDWGRDAMIALAGLTLTTNRPHLARNILHGFAGLVDRGMLPNCFPERGDEPRYNTVDAALWFFEALLAYFEATGDAAFVKELWPVLTSIIDAYVTGTRYGIRVDPRDGLVHAGEEGTQLTWMDAKVGDWVVTPRAGKPIEISALWYNALHAMVRFAAVTGNDAGRYAALAETTRAHFFAFLERERGLLFRRSRRTWRQRPLAAAQSDRRRLVARVAARRRPTPRRRRRLQQHAVDAVRPAHLGPRIAGLRRTVRRRAIRARSRLPSRDGLAVVDRSLRRSALARLRRQATRPLLFGPARAPHHGARLGDVRRDIRRRSAVRAQRNDRPGVVGRGNPARVARDHRSAIALPITLDHVVDLALEGDDAGR